MEVRVIEGRISHSAESIHLCFPANISESNESEILPKMLFSPSIPSFFPPTISESADSTSSVLDERLSQFCPSICSIFPATTTQTNSPANDEIVPIYHRIDSFFPPRCDSDSDSFVSSGGINNVINRYLRSFSIQSYFPPRKSSSVTSINDHPSPSVESFIPARRDSDHLVGYEINPNGRIFIKPNLKVFAFADLKAATKNFKSDILLGDGTHEKVFKGCMDEKRLSPSKVGTRKSTTLVAIKKLSSQAMQGFQEWQQNFNAKISDFDLAILGPSMYGYAAPEYILIDNLYVKSDVYGFGIVLLAMLTGLRELDTKGPSGQKKLVDWLKPCLSNERQLKTIMDARMEGQYSSTTALQAAQLTLKCLESDPTNRPSMKDVVEALECIQPIKEKPKETKINLRNL